MKKILLTLIWSMFMLISFGQKNSSYFQQEVNYEIEVTLDDANHTLSGVTKIEYINNSPDDLESIYFHVWANAYKNQGTAFAKQQVQNGSTKFFFAKNNERGWYTELDFKVDGKKMDWHYDNQNIDIALVALNQKLKPNESIQFEIPFKIKIPNYFSRMGHVDQAYYITQWYPKPAVYDQEGWHPMPYLDMGEFYAEFGKFDVKITLPKDYVVAATGQLQTETEKAFLDNKVRETNKFINKKYPRGSDRTIPLFEKDTFPNTNLPNKTIHYTAENIHDFAWFADKRFFVQKSRIELSKNNNVNTWAFFNKAEFHLWLNATKYLDQAVKFYSQKVGAYPFPHATAVSNPFAAAGAMEYPMVTLVDKMFSAEDLDVVIAHEVGHNWFQGILGFNERDYTWLDEGLNSYYERLYHKNYYPDSKPESLPKFLQQDGELGLMELIKSSMQKENLHQAIGTPVNEMTEMNYGIGSYDRTADVMNLYLTPIKMKSFFNEWKFKHPQPKDFITHFDLEDDEVFKDLIYSTKKVDYKIVSVSKSNGYQLKIQNKNGIAVPFKLSMIAGDRKKTQKVDGFVGTKIIEIPPHSEGIAINKFIIDKDREIPDVNRKNNTIRTSGLFKKMEPLRLRFLSGVKNPERTNLYWLPALGWNNYDKTMLGVVLHNNDLSVKNFEFALAPMYGTASKNLVGTGVLKYNFFPESSLFQRVTLGINAKRFSQRYDWDDQFYDDFTKLAPKIEFVFKKKRMVSSVQHKIAFRYVNISINEGFTTIDNPIDIQRKKRQYSVNELKYTFQDSKVTSPLKLEVTAHQGEGFVKLFSNYKQFIPYRKSGKGATLRGFLGWMPQFDSQPAKVEFTSGGFTNNVSIRDYMFDETLLGRTQAEGIFSQQYFNRDARLRTLANVVGSEDWMLAIGVSSTVPGPLPVRPYFDATIYRGFDLDKLQLATLFSYSGGIAIVGIPNALEIYIPFFESKDITDSLSYRDTRDSLFRRISFLIDINNLQQLGKESIRFY